MAAAVVNQTTRSPVTAVITQHEAIDAATIQTNSSEPGIWGLFMDADDTSEVENTGPLEQAGRAGKGLQRPAEGRSGQALLRPAKSATANLEALAGRFREVAGTSTRFHSARGQAGGKWVVPEAWESSKAAPARSGWWPAETSRPPTASALNTLF